MGAAVGLAEGVGTVVGVGAVVGDAVTMVVGVGEVAGVGAGGKVGAAPPQAVRTESVRTAARPRTLVVDIEAELPPPGLA